ncbi:MAG: ABC transporter substrate-binding protein [Cyclobacteriaceae bacterium]
MPADGHKTIIDQLGSIVKYKTPVKRIISLVPSQTELLFDLGLGDRIVGISKFCIHPAKNCREKPKVGGTKRIKRELIDQLEPDLIIANKEENEQSQIESLARDYPIWVSDIKNLSDVYLMIKALAEMLDCSSPANILINQIKAKFGHLGAATFGKAVYLIWRKPYLSVGSDTFIHQMMRFAGFENCLADETRYPEMSTDQLAKLDPDYVLLSSEPYPFKEAHIKEVKEICPRSKVLLVDGEMFSWYGSRLLKAADYFGDLNRNLRSNAH